MAAKNRFIKNGLLISDQVLDVHTSALVLAVFEVLPLGLDLKVVLKFRVGFDRADAEAVEDFDHVRHQHGIHALALVSFADGDQVQVAQVVFPQCLEQMNESKRQQPPFAALQRA